MSEKPSLPWLFVVFLLLLRIAIGWHFCYEGVEKIESFDAGSRSTTKPFTSAGYLRESNGPFAPVFRNVAGDPDKEALDRLVINPGGEQLEGRATYKELLPEAVKQDWEDYLRRFIAHYDLPAELQDRARQSMDQAQELAARWLAGAATEEKGSDDPKPFYEVERSLDNATVKLKRTPRERVQDYRDTLERIKRIEKDEQPAFDSPVRKDLNTLKGEARTLRTELLADLNKFLINRLDPLLTADAEMTAKKKEKGPLPAPVSSRNWWTDRIVAYGLVVVGVCLIIGFFSRTNAVLAALFLLSLYLAMPPWPGLPDNPRAEGHYLIVNKNLIEMLALLVLATLPTGRWLGLDGLVHALNPFRKRTAVAAPVPSAPV